MLPSTLRMKMKNYFIKALFACASIVTGFVSFAETQMPSIDWQKSLGGVLDDFANSVTSCSDGGYIVAGTSFSSGPLDSNHGYSDYWVQKLDASGNDVWQVELGGSYPDNAESIASCSDGGCVVAGYSLSMNGDVSGHHGELNNDYWVVRLNGDGTIRWQESLGGSDNEYAYCIIACSDGGFAVAGQSTSDDGDVSGHHGDFYSSDAWILKLDSSGKIQWQKSLGGSGNDGAYSIIQTYDGGFAIAGFSASTNGDVVKNAGDYDYWIVKLNVQGIIEWQRTLGGSQNEIATSILQNSDGSYVLAGWTASNDGDVTGNHGLADEWVVKLDSQGILLWQRCLGGSQVEQNSGLKRLDANRLLVCGYSNSSNGDVTGNHGLFDYWLVILDNQGNLEEQESLGGSGVDVATSCTITSNGTILVVGYSNSNDKQVSGNQGLYDYWVAKLFPFKITTSAPQEPVRQLGLTLYPNPASDRLTIECPSAEQAEIQIFNPSGEIVFSELIRNSPSLINTPIDVSTFSKGVYFVVVQTASQKFEGEFLKQ